MEDAFAAAGSVPAKMSQITQRLKPEDFTKKFDRKTALFLKGIFRFNFELLSTVWRLPIFKLWPIHWIVMTVSRRQRRAIITFFRSVFFRSISSVSDHCLFLSSSLATNARRTCACG